MQLHIVSSVYLRHSHLNLDLEIWYSEQFEIYFHFEAGREKRDTKKKQKREAIIHKQTWAKTEMKRAFFPIIYNFVIISFDDYSRAITSHVLVSQSQNIKHITDDNNPNSSLKSDSLVTTFGIGYIRCTLILYVNAQKRRGEDVKKKKKN